MDQVSTEPPSALAAVDGSPGVLVDTSVWVDHLRRGEPDLEELLRRFRVRIHPFVLGELACGRLDPRREVLELLGQLPRSERAEHREVLAMVERRRLWARGIGWVDAHLLASALLERLPLWTRDRALRAVASDLGLSWSPRASGA